MRIRRTAHLVALTACLGGCPSKQEDHPSERLQTIGLKLEAAGVPAGLEIAISMPEAADSKPVVEAMSGAIHQALRACTQGEAPLEFKGDRTLGLRLAGAAITNVLTEPGPGTECLVTTLEGHELRRRFDPPLDVHVLLRKLASPG